MSTISSWIDSSEQPPRRRVPTQHRAAERVDRILAAAKAILGESGYEATTTKEIAQRAQVAVGSLYQFFAGKEEIVATVAAQLIDNMLELIADLAASKPGGWAEAVEAIVDRYADFYRNEPAFRALWVEHRLDSSLAQADRQLNTAIATSVKQLLDPLAKRDLPLVDYEIAIEIGDALLDMAFARDPRGEQRIIAAASVAMQAYLNAASANSLS
jgi:AcrR family transcriptional regulator